MVGSLLYGSACRGKLPPCLAEQMVIDDLLGRLPAHLSAHLSEIAGCHVHAVGIEGHIAVGLVMLFHPAEEVLV